MFTLENDSLPKEAIQQKVLTLDIYSESIIATRHDTCQTFEVCPDSLQRVFTNVTLTTGLLPARTLFFERVGPNLKVGIHIPAADYSVRVASDSGVDELYRIPVPDLVFAGSGRTYGVYALKNSRICESSRLYYAPFPNVDQGGRICFGNLNVPDAKATNIQSVFNDFMQSRFNQDYATGKSKSHKNNVIDLWKAIQNKRSFPVKELMPHGESTLINLVSDSSRRTQDVE